MLHHPLALRSLALLLLLPAPLLFVVGGAASSSGSSLSAAFAGPLAFFGAAFAFAFPFAFIALIAFENRTRPRNGFGCCSGRLSAWRLSARGDLPENLLRGSDEPEFAIQSSNALAMVVSSLGQNGYG